MNRDFSGGERQPVTVCRSLFLEPMKKVNIVKHRTGWCATFRNSKPDPDAVSDRTACNHYVTLRGGSAVGIPDCVECKKVLARRRVNRKGA